MTLGPIVSELPPRCWPQPRQLTWGREMIILLDEPADIVAGAGFNVRLEPDSSGSKGKAIAAPTTKRTAIPRPMIVPRELLAISRFEPSGAIWVPRLARYVIVSDDTGLPGRNDHAPWLFTMDAKGRVGERPLAVRGVERFNDLESVAAGPGSALYALSSQSYSKKGKRKASRQIFCRLVPEAEGYRMKGSVRLATLLDAAGSGRLASLGIGSTRQLNIEGMTGIDESLLIGLKAPLAADGSALIWRMTHPERLLSSGKLEDAGLALWGKVKLSVEVDGRSVPAGIAEILRLPDGSLVIGATASGIKPARQSGALWHVAPPPSSGGRLQARRIHTFPDRKPEGLAVAPRPGHLVVVFDVDAGSPAWLELPWPRK
jgi:hypothetical protein